MAVQAQPYPLCGNNYSQDWISEINGCGNSSSLNQFSFNAQPKTHYHHNHQQQQQQMLLQEIQSLNHKNDTVFFNPNATITQNDNSQTSLFDHFEKRNKQEIDQYIKSQNERLRSILQEQRKQEIVTLIRKAEPKLLAILKQKESEISEARKRTVELEDLLRKLEEENESWQRLAQENQATVVSLTHALNHAPTRRRKLTGEASDAESCCGGDGDGEDERRVCRNCFSRKASVLLLPCRHFCSCKECEGFLDSCPVCEHPKKATIEALTF